MRFFHGSLRYSVDLDLDTPKFSLESLKSSAEKALAATGRSLRQRNLGVLQDERFSKQGENVLRLKLAILSPEGENIPTRIEFSRREMPLVSEKVTLSPSHETRSPFGLPSFLLPTYTAIGMSVLKTKALADRNRNMIRDVFDFSVLRPDAPPAHQLGLMKITSTELRAAARWVLGRDTDFREYEKNVRPYMGGQQFLNEASWDDLRNRVANTLIEWSENIHG